MHPTTSNRLPRTACQTGQGHFFRGEEFKTDKYFIDSFSHEHTLLITREGDPVEITRGRVIPRPDISTSHEKADNIIIQQTFMAVEQGAEYLSVMADDTDVYILLLHYYNQKELHIPMFMESPVHVRQTIDIRATAKEHANILPNLLAVHGLSRCDTVASCYGIGKIKILKTPKQGNHSLMCLGDSNANWPDVVKQATSFMLACYGVPKLDSMTQARANLWKTKVGRRSSTMPKLCSLPPTDLAFMENLKRAHFQRCIWKHALDLNVPDLNPVQYGWTKDKAVERLAAVHVPPNTDLTLSYIQGLIKCSCSSDPPYVSANCSCKKAGMPCSVSYAFKITNCYRAQKHGDDDDDDDHGGDDENDDDN